MTQELQTPALPQDRVATRPGTSRVSDKRRAIYQRHLLLFVAVSAVLLAADLYTSPEIQWAHFLVVPWFLVFLLHSAGLKSRGYSFGEMFIPPRQRPVQEVYTVPLDYELVRTRQLRDGVANAAAALRDQHTSLADRAVAAADALLAAVEETVAGIRNRSNGDAPTEKLLPEVQAALAALDELHRGLLAVEVLEQPPETVPIARVEERARALRPAG